jgi:hypothetical protein
MLLQSALSSLQPAATAGACERCDIVQRHFCSDEEDDDISEDLDAALRSLQALTSKVK